MFSGQSWLEGQEPRYGKRPKYILHILDEAALVERILIFHLRHRILNRCEVVQSVVELVEEQETYGRPG